MKRALACLILGIAGCRSTPPVVEGERIEFLVQGTPAPYDGYLVTPIVMLRIVEKLRGQ